MQKKLRSSYEDLAVRIRLRFRPREDDRHRCGKRNVVSKDLRFQAQPNHWKLLSGPRAIVGDDLQRLLKEPTARSDEDAVVGKSIKPSQRFPRSS